MDITEYGTEEHVKTVFKMEEDGGSILHIYTKKLKSLLLQGTGFPLKPRDGWALESELL